MERFKIPNNINRNNIDESSGYTVVKTTKYNEMVEEYTKLKNEKQERDIKNNGFDKEYKIAELIYELRQKGLLIHMANPIYVIRVLSEFVDKNYELK